MRFSTRLIFTFVTTVCLGLAVSRFMGLSLSQSLLVATPAALMLGSMLTLLYLAKQGDRVDAKKQLTTLLVVEFLLVPLGAGVALVAFFVLRAAEQAPPAL